MTHDRCFPVPSPEDLRHSDDGEEEKEEKEGTESEQQEDHHSREGFLKQVNCAERPGDERVNLS